MFFLPKTFLCTIKCHPTNYIIEDLCRSWSTPLKNCLAAVFLPWLIIYPLKKLKTYIYIYKTSATGHWSSTGWNAVCQPDFKVEIHSCLVLPFGPLVGLSLVKRTCGHLQRSDCPQSSRWGDIPLTLDESSYIAVWTASGWSTWHRARGQAPVIIEGSLEVKLPTIWTDGKAEVGRVREEKRREEERRSEKRKSQKKEDVGAQKGRKVAKHCFFPLICGSGRSKSRLAKAAGAEPPGEMRDEKLHGVVARSTFPSQMYKRHQRRSLFQSWAVQKGHHVVARSRTTATTLITLQPQLQLQLPLQLLVQLQLQLHYNHNYNYNYGFNYTSTTKNTTTTTTTSTTLQLQIQLQLQLQFPWRKTTNTSTTATTTTTTITTTTTTTL